MTCFLLLIWLASFFFRRVTLFKFGLAVLYSLVCITWGFVSSHSIHYFTNVQLDEEKISRGLLHSLSDYGNDNDTKLSWNKMQTLFQCCGAKNHTDWIQSTAYIPMSCFGERLSSQKTQILHKNPCLPQFINYAQKEIKAKCIPGLVISGINLAVSIIMTLCTFAGIVKTLSCGAQRQRMLLENQQLQTIQLSNFSDVSKHVRTGLLLLLCIQASTTVSDIAFELGVSEPNSKFGALFIAVLCLGCSLMNNNYL